MIEIFGIEPIIGKVISRNFDLENHPTGFKESIPVVIFKGKNEGPIISISANLHGDEYTGTLVVHELLNDIELLSNLNGTIIFFPSLNPCGASLGKREFSLTNIDPNRTFPEKNVLAKTFVEKCTQKIFNELKKHTTFHIDIHCSKIYSIPFTYLDPPRENIKLYDKMSKLAKTFGLFTVIDNRESYFTKNYHKTFTGALVNNLEIPAFTIELGPKKIVDTKMIKVGVNGIKSVLKELSLLPGSVVVETNKSFNDKVHEINIHPNCPESGIVKFLVKPGDYVKKGDNVATLRDIRGKKIGDGFVRTKLEGYVVCQFEGAFFYVNQPLLKIATKFEE